MVCAEANRLTIKVKRMRLVFFILRRLNNSLGRKNTHFRNIEEKNGIRNTFFSKNENKIAKNAVSSKNFLFLCR